MDQIEILAAIEDIKKLKSRYFRAVDTKDIKLLESVFTQDCVVDYRGAATDPLTGINHVPEGTGQVLTGLKNYIDHCRRDLAFFTSVHHGHMPEIEISTTTTARGIWAMMDVLRFPTGAPISGLDGYGHYYETYEKIDDSWKIKTLRLKRLLLDFHSS